MLAWMTAFGISNPVQASSQHVWYVTSPDHGQTYAYGSRENLVWAMPAPNHNLVLYATYSNEPYAQGGNRRYDYFTINFPNITLGSDGVTFFYHPSKGIALPVAARHDGFLGLTETKLLPTSYLTVSKVHGYLTFVLVVGDHPFTPDPDFRIGFDH